MADSRLLIRNALRHIGDCPISLLCRSIRFAEEDQTSLAFPEVPAKIHQFRSMDAKTRVPFTVKVGEVGEYRSENV